MKASERKQWFEAMVLLDYYRWKSKPSTERRDGTRYRGLITRNGALKAAKQSKPDVILADVSMPRLGGYELCQRIRADGIAARIRLATVRWQAASWPR